MINQFSANYNPIQDRILFRFNTTDLKEFRFWFSRRVASKLLKVLPEGTQEGSEIVQELKQQTEQKQDKSPQKLGGDGKKEASTAVPVKKAPKFISGNDFPTGEEPILLADISFALEGASYKCSFVLATKKTVTVRINPDLMLKVHSLISLMTQNAGWYKDLKQPDVISPAQLH